MKLRRLTLPVGSTLAALLLLTGGCAASGARRAAAEGARLYDAGDYDAALPLLEQAAEKALHDAELFYQLGYIYEQRSMGEKSRQYREKALPLLEKQCAAKDATLELWYYRTALYANLNRQDEMRKTAQEAAVKFDAGTGLSGEDLFRLGRLYQFAGDGSKGAAAYRRAVEAFAKESKPNPVFYSLALLADARTDFQAHRFADSARKLADAGKVSPHNAPSPYETALAHLGAGEWQQAQDDFGKVRDEELSTDAQYGADLARHLQGAGGRIETNSDGKALLEMDNPSLESAIKAAADALRKARAGQDEGQSSSEETRASEQRFFSLAAEWMLRGNTIRDTALAGGYADLIRR